MTIKGPHAHNYSGGLGDLLGWSSSNYDYVDAYDVEAHRRHLQQQQQQYEFDSSEPPNTGGGFANALNNNNPSSPPQQSNYYSTDQAVVQTQTHQGNSMTPEEEAERMAKCEKMKKQAINVVFFVVVFLIWVSIQ